ncbi:MAG: CotH kinase family protein [Pirellulaceae bacterium]
MELYFSDVNIKPASPTVSAQVDLASIFGGVNEVHVGWTAATSDSYNAHDVVRFEMLTGQGQSGLSTTRINLIEHIDLLQPGTNVLAFQGLNLNASDEDFLLRAQLTMEANELGRTTYFTSPTPGDVNGFGGLTSFVTVDYSHSTKTFVDNFQLELTADAANATIRYTTDGSLPTASSTIYTSPISITQTSRIRARVFEPGKEPGPIRSEGFIKLSSNLTNFNGKPFESNLPVMVFESFGGNVHAQDTQLVPVTGVFLNPGDDGMASILDEPEFGGRAGMRIRGQTSQGFPKKQYALELWDEGNSDTRPLLAGQAGDRSASFFGLPGESDWVLNGPYSDKTQLNNYLTFLWSNRIGLYAPKARLVEVFLNQNGGSLSYSSDYMGTYVLLEKIKIDENRIDIAQLDPNDLQTPDITGGYVWKKDKPGAGDIPFSTDQGQSLRMVEPSDAEIHPLQKNWLNNYINQFEAALYGPDFADPQFGYARYIDVDSWVDTWLLVETTKNIDGFRLSTYYHKDRNGKIEQGPAWDYNLSLANGNYLKGAYPEGWYHDGLDSNAYPYWDRLFEDPAFQQRVVDRWNELRQGPWSTEQLLSDIDEAVNALTNGDARMDSPTVPNSNPIARNFSKWRTLTSYQWPNCFFGTGDCPPSPLPNGRSPRNYGDYIFIMKDFVERRTAWIDTQFPAGPTFDPQGGQIAAGTEVSLSSNVAGAIYYTLDGTDPVSATFVESEQIVFSSGHNVEYLVPTSDGLMNNCAGVLANATSCFMSPQYVASAGDNWTAGQIGVGYDSQGDYSHLIQTQLTDMQGQNTSVYLRIPLK